MLPEYFEFSLPTKVIYGIGITKNLSDQVQFFGKRKAIIVTDKILSKLGIVSRIADHLSQSSIHVCCTFDNVPPDSTIQTVMDCAEMAKANECDMIIAIGGGSVMDTAKVANILIVKGGDIHDHMGAYLLDPNESILPSLFIPTTAGTGSEVSKVAVIADLTNNQKLPFAEKQFMPDLSVLDPELTVSMPGKLTAATGMDALTHAIEAYTSKEWSPASDALALHAVRLLYQNILVACAYPDNLEARGNMLIGSFIAGMAFTHAMVGITHSLAHALGGIYHIPHGIANALVLPEVMAFNYPSCIERYADIAMAMGITFPQIVAETQCLLQSSHSSHQNCSGNWKDTIKHLITSNINKTRTLTARAMNQFDFIDSWFRKKAAKAAIQKIHTLNSQLAYLTGMPLTIKEAGVNDNLERLDQLVATAMDDGAMIYNPVEATPTDVKNIFKQLYLATPKPIPVAYSDLSALPSFKQPKEMTQIFTSEDMFYDVIGEFFERLKKYPTIGPALASTNLCVQFNYKNPDCIITILAKGEPVQMIKGEFEGKPDVIMTMNADFAHLFWQGKANLITALTKRQVVAKGAVPQTIKFLPVLKPAFEIYPAFLREKGLSHLIIS